jgi:hypothetical protein
MFVNRPTRSLNATFASLVTFESLILQVEMFEAFGALKEFPQQCQTVEMVMETVATCQ